MRTLLSLLLLVPLLFAAPAWAADDGDGYVVLEAVGSRPEYRPAVDRLAKLHDAPVVSFDPNDLAPLVEVLRRRRPATVVVVVPPETVELDFQRRFLQMATEVDDDPFVDFAYGYVTGRTGKDALGLVEAGVKANAKPRPFVKGSLAGGGRSSYEGRGTYRLRTVVLPEVRGVVKGEGEEHDRAFVRDFLPKLASCGVVEFVGHGMPSYVGGGPDWKDLADLDLDAAAVLSVPCFTGVTHVWYQEDFRAGVLHRKTIPLEESVALRVIAAAPCGYTAFLCGRPAGPELYTDMVRLVGSGMTLGDARRRDYDKTVLGFLGFGEERMVLPPLRDGQRLPAARDSVRDVMLEGAAGGVLYGDPAVRPFRPTQDEDPVVVKAEREGKGLAIRVTCPWGSLFTLCADQTARYGGSMALRAYARVPLGDLPVGDVSVASCRLGTRDVGHRLIWAVEDDRGERFLHVKVMFSRQDARQPGDLETRVVVTKADGEGRTRGGEVEAPERERQGGGGGGAPPRDLASTEIDAVLEQAAARFDVPHEAVRAALVATAATLGKGEVPPQQALDDLAKLGPVGFRAVCALVAAGHTHYRTWQLMQATYEKGDEDLLLALAEEDLPGYAVWSVLEGLGATGSAKGRAYLLERIAREQDAGCFMAAAQGLAHLGEQRAVPVIGERLLAFEPGWSGVEGHLVSALGRISGPEAREILERYAADERAKQAAMARRFLAQPR